jgi:uncharacterized SAM-binding protein YcdF (DUF218 family)
MRGNKTQRRAARPDLAVDPKKTAAKIQKPIAPREKPEKPTRRFLGLQKRKEKWVLTWRGRIVVWGVLAVLAVTFLLTVHPFLAITERVDTQYLVIEGWVPNYGLQESIAEFKSKPYVKVFTVGAEPLSGLNIEPGDSVAGSGRARLQNLGFSPDLIQAVPAHIKYRNRTYESALALRKWIEENHAPVTSFNLVTLGPHARRSRLLFEKAFAGQARVGIISVEDREYNPKRWWKYSEGVKELIGEGVGYVYVRFFFHPNVANDF